MKRTLYILALGIFGITTTEFGVIGILPQIANAYHVTIDKAGWLLSIFALIIAISAPFITLAFTNANRKKTLLLVLAIFSISNILCAIAPSFPFLLFARALPAILHPVFWSIGLAVAAGTVHPDESPKAVSIVFGGLTLATVFGIPMATFIAEMFNWRASFLLSAVINIISFLSLWVFLPFIPVARVKIKTSYWRILGNRKLLFSLLLACLVIAAMFSTYGYMAGYLKNVTHMNGSAIGLMLLIFGITGVAGNYFAGKFLSKNRERTTILFIVSLLGIHGLTYFMGASYNLMIFVIIFWGFIHAGGFLISNVNITSSTSEAPEFINSIFTSCGNLAVTIGSTVGGLAIVNIGIHQLPWTSIILLALALLVFTLKSLTKG
ncbi:MFS transporter [Pedobacter cryoconitis]|uniref:Putative MFS family arabinose efflux permease n=1 Tax=Pedobacter cryoconitis TaxID=188932 RepID=A0A327SFC1_9SPHI|nr:MFS transporter [Pedobacter cryoconitis]RAJ27275.1 putative MFS family arabinose efflux permease [Pedobacter cryoconitis]